MNENSDILSLIVRLDYISRCTSRAMKTEEKCNMAIQRCKDGKIVVFEGGLTASEEALLIKVSMNAIDYETFHGVEIYTPGDYYSAKGFFKRIPERRVTVIAPAATEMCVKSF